MPSLVHRGRALPVECSQTFALAPSLARRQAAAERRVRTPCVLVSVGTRGPTGNLIAGHSSMNGRPSTHAEPDPL